MKGKRFFIFAFVISLLVSGGLGVARALWEGGQRTVSVALDLTDIVASTDLSSQLVILQHLHELDARLLVFSMKAYLDASPELLEEIRSFDLVLRLDAWISTDELTLLLADVSLHKIAGLLLRYPVLNSAEHLEALAQRLRANQVFIAWDEFQDAALLRSYVIDNLALARAHLLTSEERAGLGQSAALDRLMRAVRERGIRLIALPGSSPDQIESDFKALLAMLDQENFQAGGLTASTAFSTFPPLLTLLAMGALALLALVLTAQTGLSRLHVYFLSLAGVLLAASGLILFENETRLALAWLVVVITPVAGYEFMKDFAARFDGALGGVLAVAGFTLVSLAGGILAAGFLSDSLYLLGIETFRGVKLALMLPIALIALLELRRIDWEALRLWELALGLGVVLVLAVVLLRSDNVSPLAASGEELDLRGLLESWLYARPRFKEIVIGHPALFLWGALMAMGRRRLWAVALLLAGLIGQVSILNSFMHLHTPLALTLLRVLNGLVLGLLLGAAGYLSFSLARRYWPGKRLE